jgi:hypothetical protein
MDDLVMQGHIRSQARWPNDRPRQQIYEEGYAQGEKDKQRLLDEVKHYQLIASRAEVARQDALIACLKEEIDLLKARKRA